MKADIDKIEYTIRFLEDKIFHLRFKISRVSENKAFLDKEKEYKKLEEQICKWENKRIELEAQLEKKIDESLRAH